MADSKVITEKKWFTLRYLVQNNIKASPEKVWQLLTDVANFTRWNSTLSSIEGTIALGGTIKMQVPQASDRVFTVKVSVFEPCTRMLWEDGFSPLFTGKRSFVLSQQADGSTNFEMQEIFSGLFLPLIASQLPDFAPIFKQYAADLKQAAEQ